MRLDENILPTKWRGATVSEDEMQKLRRVKNVIRRGRISSIEETNIVFESGEEMNLPEGTLIVDCARNSTKWPQNKKVFDGDTINLQYLMLPPLGLGFMFLSHRIIFNIDYNNVLVCRYDHKNCMWHGAEVSWE